MASPVHRAPRLFVEERDVVGGVSRRVHDPERAVPELETVAVAHRTHAIRGRREHVAVERAHSCRAVGAGGARDQARRIDQVARADLVHPDLRARIRLEERPDAAGVIHVDVGDDDVGEVVGADAKGLEPRQDAIVIRLRPGLDEARLRRGHQIDGVELAFACHHGVDREYALGDRAGLGSHVAKSRRRDDVELAVGGLSCRHLPLGSGTEGGRRWSRSPSSSWPGQ